MQRVMLVEDSADNRLLVCALLEDRYTIDAYENGRDAGCRQTHRPAVQNNSPEPQFGTALPNFIARFKPPPHRWRLTRDSNCSEGIMRMAVVFLLFPCLIDSLSAQSRPDLYECEGCEAIHEHSFDGLSWRSAVAPANEKGERLVLRGRVFASDGRTPAANVILYVHQTNAEGIYPKNGSETGWGRRHGYLRAWVKTNQNGEYQFETIRPGTYPTRSDPAHIHFIIKEPSRREYWIDDVVFTDDPLVNAPYRARLQNRGGSGIVTPRRDAAGVWQVRRDIVLER